MAGALTYRQRAELDAFFRANKWARPALHDALEYARTRFAAVERVYAPEEVTVIDFTPPVTTCEHERCNGHPATVLVQRGGRYRCLFTLTPDGARPCKG